MTGTGAESLTVGAGAAGAARSTGLGVPGLEVGVDVDVADPERPAHAHGGELARLDQAVDRHRRDAHELGDLLHGQEAGLGERLRHRTTLLRTALMSLPALPRRGWHPTWWGRPPRRSESDRLRRVTAVV